MNARPLPDWLIEAFEKHGWWNMSNVCDWADGMFHKDDYTIECYFSNELAGVDVIRLFASVDGDTYITGGRKAFISEPVHVGRYLEYMMERLENLADCL